MFKSIKSTLLPIALRQLQEGRIGSNSSEPLSQPHTSLSIEHMQAVAAEAQGKAGAGGEAQT